MKVRLMTLLMLIVSATSALQAQQQTISGHVMEVSSEPLPGVTIMIDGTTQGTVTNADGKFSLQLPQPKANLTISYVGYITKKMQVKAGETDLAIYMQEDGVANSASVPNRRAVVII